MKPHIQLKLKQEIPGASIPYWQHIIRDKTAASDKLQRDVDAIISQYGLPVWVAQEYQPAGRFWNSAEIDSGLNRIYRLILQENTPIPPSLIQDISLLPIVEYVYVGQVASSALPTGVPVQMSRTTDRRSRDSIYLEEAHQLNQGNSAITIAVLDTGISLNHPELKDSLLPGYDFVDIIDGAGEFLGDYLEADEIPEDEVGHGTHVAGIIAAFGRAMPAGVAPRCKILPVRVLGAYRRGGKPIGAGLVDNINDGIKWAVERGADIINMSLGIKHTGGGLPHQEVVDYAHRRGVTVVAPSGNDGQEELYYPGALPGVIAVGAIDEAGEVAAFSTYGRQVDLLAPGENIYSSYRDNGYAFASGTSQAAPFVAGAVALLKSYALEKGESRLSDRRVQYLLKHTADKVDRRFKHPQFGFGKLNLIDALKLLDYKLSIKGGDRLQH